MSSLFESLSRIVGRVELVAKGADADRRDAEVALDRGRVLEAREHARKIVERVPDSALALALWADAAEGAWLHDEAKEALTRLSALMPWRGDVWVRLGRVTALLGGAEARACFLRATDTEDRDAIDEALLALTDLDLEEGDPQRASRWLDRVNVVMAARAHDVQLRRAECAVMLGHAAEARAAIDTLPATEELIARRLAVRLWIETLEAPSLADRAMREERVTSAARVAVLSAPRYADLFADVVASITDADLVARLREVARATALDASPRVVAAFALAEGRPEDAKEALSTWALREPGTRRAIEALVSVALRTRDAALLVHAMSSEHLPEGARAIVEATDRLADGDVRAAVDALDAVVPPAAEGLLSWAAELRAGALARWVEGDRADEAALLRFAHDEAHALADLDAIARIETLKAEQTAPIRVAVVGEFNAGKSTFINALVGADVAPTGILPTTATLHFLGYAPDAFARVVVEGDRDRVVPHQDLKATLARLDGAGAKIVRVNIYAPIERLRIVEVIDTPGFNAPNPEHARAAARAFDEAHVVVWLLDASGPLKATERDVLSSIRERKIPTIVLLNKLDRLKPEDVATVVDHVEASLRDEKIAHLGRPIPLSARLALKGKLGDAEALAASNWESVEKLLSDDVDGRSTELRALGLLRGLGGVVDSLGGIAARRGEEAKVAREAQRERTTQRLAAANALIERREELRAALFERARPLLAALAEDLRPLARLERGSTESVPVRRYRIGRFADRLAAPLLAELGALVSQKPDAEMVRAARATLRGIATIDTSTDALDEADFDRMFDALVASFDEWLRLPEGPPPTREPDVRQGRLAALGAALERRGASS